jgi:hypothetical protein
MKMPFVLAATFSILAAATLFQTSSVHAQSGSYCDGHSDGHRAGSETFGMGYPGYPGCPGDPGSPGGNASPYQRGFAAGMRAITQQMCRQNPLHQNCR